jgi:hypothetical protein
LLVPAVPLNCLVGITSPPLFIHFKVRQRLAVSNALLKGWLAPR